MLLEEVITIGLNRVTRTEAKKFLQHKKWWYKYDTPINPWWLRYKAMLGAVILYWGDLWIEGGDLFLGEVNMTKVNGNHMMLTLTAGSVTRKVKKSVNRSIFVLKPRHAPWKINCNESSPRPPPKLLDGTAFTIFLHGIPKKNEKESYTVRKLLY